MARTRLLRLPIEEVYAVLLSARAMGLLRLQRIAEHAAGRRLTVQQLPRAIHVAELLDGDHGDENGSPGHDQYHHRSGGGDGGAGASRDRSDLHEFIQDYVRENLDKVIVSSGQSPKAAEEAEVKSMKLRLSPR